MRGYSIDFSSEECAFARAEGVDASYKDLTQVCGRIRGKNAEWAMSFLESVAKGEKAVLYTAYNKKIGHRRELGGKKGRYPKKAAGMVLKVLKSAMANGNVKGLGSSYMIIASSANKKASFPRSAPRGGWMRSNYEISRIEIVLKPTSTVPKGVEVRPPAKKETGIKKEEKKSEETKKEKKEEAKISAKVEKVETKNGDKAGAEKETKTIMKNTEKKEVKS